MKNAELKEIIKKSAIESRFFKNQRKTVNLVGKREIESGYASMKLVEAKKKNRLYNVAYGLILGRTYEQIENKVREGNELTEFDFATINQLIEKYREIKTEEVSKNE